MAEVQVSCPECDWTWTIKARRPPVYAPLSAEDYAREGAMLVYIRHHAEAHRPRPVIVVVGNDDGDSSREISEVPRGR